MSVELLAQVHELYMWGPPFNDSTVVPFMLLLRCLSPIYLFIYFFYLLLLCLVPQLLGDRVAFFF